MSPPHRVVITGVGCISPNGLGRQAYFKALCAGMSGLNRITRFAPDHLACQIAGEVTGFDPVVWLSKKDLPHVALTVPFALAASTEALVDASIIPEELSLEERRRFGVLIGSGGGSAEFLERQYGIFFDASSEGRASVYAVPSNTIGTLSSELSMRFNLRGLSHVISTGCTSSTDAIGYAFHHIQAGRLDKILCGGVDCPITDGIMTGFCHMKVVSCSWNQQPESGSRPFSKDRDGFVLGEGAWMFVLESLTSALARGAKIYAEVKGYGATCEAYHRVRLDESGEEPARAIQLAMADAGITPDFLDYINLHGTSTLMNDRIETQAMRKALGKTAESIPCSSTKSMIGHPQGASGSAGIAATLCAMETGILPPTINLDIADPACDLDYIPDIGRKQQTLWALCNCIGFGSKNSALILKRYTEEI
jgi:3-oxoacyl-[acyl-carrier-protein] synthase II